MISILRLTAAINQLGYEMISLIFFREDRFFDAGVQVLLKTHELL